MHIISILLLVSWPVLIYVTYLIIYYSVRAYEKRNQPGEEKSA
jgi:hypothetical protein